jgi:predicted amidophosphoribosyltransferase
VAGAFRADPRRIGGRAVLLVDDVLTSGATAQACAAALREAGAKKVFVLTAARAPQP